MYAMEKHARNVGFEMLKKDFICTAYFYMQHLIVTESDVIITERIERLVWLLISYIVLQNYCFLSLWHVKFSL